MTSETRVPPTEITGVFGTIVKRMTKKKLGRVPQQLGAGNAGAGATSDAVADLHEGSVVVLADAG